MTTIFNHRDTALRQCDIIDNRQNESFDAVFFDVVSLQYCAFFANTDLFRHRTSAKFSRYRIVWHRTFPTPSYLESYVRHIWSAILEFNTAWSRFSGSFDKLKRIDLGYLEVFGHFRQLSAILRSPYWICEKNQPSSRFFQQTDCPCRRRAVAIEKSLKYFVKRPRLIKMIYFESVSKTIPYLFTYNSCIVVSFL